MTTFDDVRQYIENGTVGHAVTVTYKDELLRRRHDWLIEDDGVLSGEEQLLFLLNELEASYVPKREVILSKAEHDALIKYIVEDNNVQVALDDLFWRDDDLFLATSNEDFVWAYLYPDKVTIKED